MLTATDVPFRLLAKLFCASSAENVTVSVSLMEYGAAGEIANPRCVAVPAATFTVAVPVIVVGGLTGLGPVAVI